jgi:hypothetical protein
MVKMIFIILLALGFFAAGEYGFGQTIYQWEDEKGILRFSDTPPSRISTKKEEKQAAKESSAKPPSSIKKEEVKSTKENPLDVLNKLQVGSRTVPIQSKKEERKSTNELNILNKMEVGNRTIPEDMKKYGPGGPEAPRRQEETSSSSSRRS